MPLIAMSNIFKYLQSSENCKKRPFEEGEKLFTAGHIVGCGYVGKKIVARCLTSKLAAQPHTVEIEFENEADHNQWKCTCSCKSGAGHKCKHIGAALIFIYNSGELMPLSCTDVQQAWGKRKKSLTEELISVEEFCHVKKYEETRVLDKCFEAEFIKECFEAVPESEASIHIQGRIRRKPEMKIRVHYDIRIDKLDIICKHAKESEWAKMLYDNLNFCLEECCINTYNRLLPCDAFNICVKTMLNKTVWHQERKYRITGSRCYSLFTYAKKNWTEKAHKYFFDEQFKGNENTRFGITEEKFAREEYRKSISSWGEVIECGLVVCKSNPWLACSPDGVVLENNIPVRILEIKSSTLGKTKTVSDCLKHLSYMEKTGNGFRLKHRHCYYAQVQLAMCILNLKSCDFVIYSKFDKSLHIENIPIDREFCYDLLYKLQNIYFDKMLHEICKYRIK